MKTKCKNCGKMYDNRGMHKHLVRCIKDRSSKPFDYGTLAKPSEFFKPPSEVKTFLQAGEGTGISFHDEEFEKTVKSPVYAINYCPNCASNVPEDEANFCFNCGCPLPKL